MIEYKDCFSTERRELNELTEGFLSEVFQLDKKEKNKWEKYEDCKKILMAICPSSEYGLAVKCLVDRLMI